MCDFKNGNHWRLNQKPYKVNNALRYIETKNIKQTNNLVKPASRIRVQKNGIESC